VEGVVYAEGAVRPRGRAAGGGEADVSGEQGFSGGGAGEYQAVFLEAAEKHSIFLILNY
jgi:hypothetical protein